MTMTMGPTTARTVVVMKTESRLRLDLVRARHSALPKPKAPKLSEVLVPRHAGAAGVKLITEGLDAVGNAISAAATKLVALASHLLHGSGNKGSQPEL
jgi:hypothetical protein